MLAVAYLYSLRFEEFETKLPCEIVQADKPQVEGIGARPRYRI
jgi:hypothetical protein